MQDRRRVVEHPADAVAAEIAHHRIAVAFRVTLDRIADRADMEARLDHSDAAHHRLVGHISQFFCFQRDAVADEIHTARVAMPAVDDHRHIDVESVAFHQPSIAGNTVTDHMIDRGADRFRKAAIAEWGGDGIGADDIFVA